MDDAVLTINKSSNHPKLTGDFGEALILYWLSKYGFEPARVDHTGIDIIARSPSAGLIGISVKTRSRSRGSESDDVPIELDQIRKAEAACKTFGCVPYFAIVIDAGSSIRGFLLSLERLREICTQGGKNLSWNWKMKSGDLERYKGDRKIDLFEFETNTLRWSGLST